MTHHIRLILLSLLLLAASWQPTGAEELFRSEVKIVDGWRVGFIYRDKLEPVQIELPPDMKKWYGKLGGFQLYHFGSLHVKGLTAYAVIPENERYRERCQVYKLVWQPGKQRFATVGVDFTDSIFTGREKELPFLKEVFTGRSKFARAKAFAARLWNAYRSKDWKVVKRAEREAIRAGLWSSENASINPSHLPAGPLGPLDGNCDIGTRSSTRKEMYYFAEPPHRRGWWCSVSVRWWRGRPYLEGMGVTWPD